MKCVLTSCIHDVEKGQSCVTTISRYLKVARITIMWSKAAQSTYHFLKRFQLECASQMLISAYDPRVECLSESNLALHFYHSKTMVDLFESLEHILW